MNNILYFGVKSTLLHEQILTTYLLQKPTQSTTQQVSMILYAKIIFIMAVSLDYFEKIIFTFSKLKKDQLIKIYII